MTRRMRFAVAVPIIAMAAAAIAYTISGNELLVRSPVSGPQYGMEVEPLSDGGSGVGAPVDNNDRTAVEVASPLVVRLGISPPLPSSIEEAIAEREVIVVGTVSSVIGERVAESPDLPSILTPPPVITPESSLNLTDFQVVPDDVLLSDGHVYVGVPVVVTCIGHASDIPEGAAADVGWPEVARTYLWFLNLNSWDPPGTRYGGLGGGIRSTMLIDGDEVAYIDGEAVSYAEGMSPAEFIEAVREAVQ